MASIVNTYVEQFPALRFIGKRYTDDDRVAGAFAAQWHEWFTKGWFAPLDPLVSHEVDNGYIGLELVPTDKRSWDYWIGVFAPAGTAVPPDYDYVDLPASPVAISWIQGRDDDGLYCKYDAAIAVTKEAGLGELLLTPIGQQVTFERYNCPRYTETDSEGMKILDRGVYLK